MTQRRKAVAASKIPERYRRMENTVGHTLTAIQSGAKLYDRHCSACHGAAGEGNGPRAQDFTPPIPPLSDPLIRKATDAYLIWKSLEGGQPPNTQKPGFAEEPSTEQVWQIIAYMRAGFPSRAPERPMQQRQSEAGQTSRDR